MNLSLHIGMLGSFTIEKNGHIISDLNNHSRKMWVLLAYLFYFHEKKIPQNELISTIWENEEDTANPTNVFKVLLHRTRHMLDELEPDFGKQLILCTRKEYYLNPSLSLHLDVTEFEEKIQAAKSAGNLQERLHLYQEAFSLYHGNFLEKFSTESWIVPLSTYYYNLYLEAVQELIKLYDETNQYEALIQICRKVCVKEKYQEVFYDYLMKNLIRTEQYEEAVHVYQTYRKTLGTEFGVQPSVRLQALFRQARQGLHADLIDIHDIPKLMHEDTDQKGALFCEMDIFKQIYQFTARGIERNGNVIHIVLIHITDIHDHVLTKRSLATIVKNLREFLCSKLRSGDIISMCSPSQFILLLPNANFENTEKVMKRLETSFYRQYPHTPAKLTHHIQAVVPDSQK